MKRMLKLGWILMIACLLLTACGKTTVEEAEAPVQNEHPTVVISEATVQAGKKAELELSIWNNPGIVGMTLELEYDESVLTLVDVKRGDALEELNFTKPKELKSGCHFPWDAETVSAEQATNGVALILTFEVSDTAAVGDYIVSVRSYGDAVDNDLAPVPLLYDDGAVKVTQ